MQEVQEKKRLEASNTFAPERLETEQGQQETLEAQASPLEELTGGFERLRAEEHATKSVGLVTLEATGIPIADQDIITSVVTAVSGSLIIVCSDNSLTKLHRIQRNQLKQLQISRWLL